MARSSQTVVMRAVTDNPSALIPTARQIVRSIDPAIPVIMVTGSHSTRLAGDAIQGGAFSYLPKPVRMQYLEHIVASVLHT